MMKLKSLLLQFIVCIVTIIEFSSCAIPMKPTGGPKDTKPPVLKLAIPVNYSKEFKDKQIILRFDEMIEVNSSPAEVIISPEIKPRPKFSAIGSSLKISFNDTALKPNTTYSIQFGKAIKDVHEGNILTGFKYVFATGSYIDSFKFNSFILDGKTRIAADKILVGLYDQKVDSLPFKKQPIYFNYTNKGTAEFTNLPLPKAHPLRLIAFNDVNGDKLLNLDEPVYYKKSIIDDSIAKNNLGGDSGILITRLLTKNPPISSIKNIGNGLILSINHAFKIKSIKSLSLNKKDSLIYFINEDKDSIFIWKQKSLLKVEFSFLKSPFLDSIELDSIITCPAIDLVPKLELKSIGISKFFLDQKQPYNIIEANKPISYIGKDQSKWLQLSPNQISTPSDSSKTKDYQIIILPKSIYCPVDSSINQDTIKISVDKFDPESYGQLKLKIFKQKFDKPFKVQVINLTTNSILFDFIVKNQKDSIYFKYMPSGSYKVRILPNPSLPFYSYYSANPEQDTLPDYYNYPKEIIIRNNWELVTEITVP
jgi:hypothetical protein